MRTIWSLDPLYLSDISELVCPETPKKQNTHIDVFPSPLLFRKNCRHLSPRVRALENVRVYILTPLPL